jgi:hypothetical protein
MARETVAGETPQIFASSRMVTLPPGARENGPGGLQKSPDGSGGDTFHEKYAIS